MTGPHRLEKTPTWETHSPLPFCGVQHKKTRVHNMQKLRDWIARARKNDPKSEVQSEERHSQQIDNVLASYEEALYKLASLAHNCEKSQAELIGCSGSDTGEEELKAKVCNHISFVYFSAQHSFHVFWNASNFNTNNSLRFMFLAINIKKNSTNA